MPSDRTPDNRTAVTFESRMAEPAAKLLQREGFRVLSAPSMQEVPLEHHTAVFTFSEQLFSGEIDLLLCMTGVGTDMLIKTMNTRYDREDVLRALSGILVVSRGPKPAKVLRALEIPIDIKVPEPNTWKELLEALDNHEKTADLQGKKIAIQEYGEPNNRLNRELVKRGAELVQTPIYRWALPDDLGPLKKAIRSLLSGDAEAALFTSKTQADHLIKVAGRMNVTEELKRALQQVFVASIGPVCSGGLRSHGIHVDFEPSRPKLAVFIREVSQALSPKKR